MCSEAGPLRIGFAKGESKSDARAAPLPALDSLNQLGSQPDPARRAAAPRAQRGRRHSRSSANTTHYRATQIYFPTSSLSIKHSTNAFRLLGIEAGASPSGVALGSGLMSTAEKTTANETPPISALAPDWPTLERLTNPIDPRCPLLLIQSTRDEDA